MWKQSDRVCKVVCNIFQFNCGSRKRSVILQYFKIYHGNLKEFFEHPFCCKISKIDGGNKKKFGKNEKFEQSHSDEKSGKIS